MSLILDALRKSEAERRKAQAAGDMLATAPRATATPLASVSAWLWPVLAVVTLALAGWLWLGRTADPSATDAATATTAGVDGINGLDRADARQDSEATAGMDGTGVAYSPPPPATTSGQPPVATASAPSPAPVTAPTAASSASAAAATPNNVPPTQASAASIAAPAPAAMPSPTATASVVPATSTATMAAAGHPLPTSAPALSTAASPSPSPSATPAAAASTASSVAALAPAPIPTPSTRGSNLLRLSDLGTAERQQLPALKVSMHMWGPTPSQRFAIIDGSRVGEGDRVGDTVVESIDQDGVVLAWNGQRLRLPVR